MVTCWNQSPPQELHHESLSVLSDRKGEGKGGALAMNDVRTTVTEMQKKIE